MKLQVWWYPQIQINKPFKVDVESVWDGVRIMDILADYDLYQYQKHVKPDYNNVGGLMMSENGENWEDWYCEDDNEYFDDPREYLEFCESNPIYKETI